jgi:hypothetical protein
MALLNINEQIKNFIELNKDDFFNKEEINNKNYNIGYISFKTNNGFQTKKIIINKIIKIISNKNYEKFFITYSIIKNGNIIKIKNYFQTPILYNKYLKTGLLSFNEVGETPQISLRKLIENKYNLKYEDF